MSQRYKIAAKTNWKTSEEGRQARPSQAEPLHQNTCTVFAATLQGQHQGQANKVKAQQPLVLNHSDR